MSWTLSEPRLEWVLFCEHGSMSEHKVDEGQSICPGGSRYPIYDLQKVMDYLYTQGYFKKILNGETDGTNK